MLCYEFDGSPIVSLNADNSLLQQCSHGYNMNQYMRGSGRYSVIVNLTGVSVASYSTLTFGVFINFLSVPYQLKVRAKYSTAPNDICPFNCLQASSNASNCVKKQCICGANDKIDYDCSATAFKITESDSYSLPIYT